MEKEPTLQEVKDILTNENIEEVIVLKREGKNDAVIMSGEQYRELFEKHLEDVFEKAEEQIQNREVIPAEIVFRELEEKYVIVFTKQASNEIRKIKQYISPKLKVPNSANRLMEQMKERTEKLSYFPRRYPIVGRKNKREYRRIVIKNYIVIYTINEARKEVEIVHIYYDKNNYLYKI